MSRHPQAPNEYEVAVENLKTVLKQRRITYRELAQGIGYSESGVKKILNARDGSFQKVAQICRYVGLSLSEIIEDGRTLKVGFSARQQTAFLEDPLLFRFYWLLVYERRSLEKVREALKISTKESFQLSRRLDGLDLLKLLPGDRLRLPTLKAVSWTGEGPFLQKLYRDWSRALVTRLAKPDFQEGELFILRYLQMTPKTFAEFKEAIHTLEAEFVRRSVQEMRIHPDKIQNVRWLTAVDDRSFVTD